MRGGGCRIILVVFVSFLKYLGYNIEELEDVFRTAHKVRVDSFAKNPENFLLHNYFEKIIHFKPHECPLSAEKCT